MIADTHTALTLMGALTLLLLTSSGRAAEPLPALKLSLPAGSVSQYGHVEGSLEGVPEADNPYDPRQVEVAVQVTTPGGRRLEVPAFYWEGQRREGDEVLPTGEKGWRFRYTPVEAGVHRLAARVKRGEQTSSSPEVKLTCRPDRSPGFVRRSRTNYRALAFDDGTPYFAVGHNVCWANNLTDYDEYWRQMEAAGENYTRIWMIHWNVALEWTGEEQGYPGIGRYNQRNAWKLDHLLAEAERRGIYVMLCFDSFNELRISQPYPAWEGNPYRKEYGGPISVPEEFFTNAEAKRLYKQRLRYLVARYGHFRSLLAWEFWNEVDIIERYVSAEVAAWHREMAREVRRLDPYDHLITTSFARSEGDPAVDGLPEMDFTQTHSYGSRDMASMAASWNARKLEAFKKPHLVGEFGTDAEARTLDQDPRGVHLHNGIWASAMTGSLGTAALWWWDSYIRPRDLYFHFRPLSEFARGVPWLEADLEPVKGVSVTFAGERPRDLVDVVLTPSNVSWSPAPYNRPQTLRVPNTEDQEALLKSLPGLLHGVRNHPTLHNPLTFELECPEESEFVVEVGGVSGHGGAGLILTVDGEVKVRKDFPDTNPPGRNDTLQQYAGPYKVALTPGKHTVVVENPGADWLEAGFTLTRYARRTRPPLRVYGLGSRSGLHLWLQNADHTWYNQRGGRAVKPVPPSRVALKAPDGAYRVEWWDTWTGERRDGGTARARGGKLEVTTPEVATDLALRLTPEKRDS